MTRTVLTELRRSNALAVAALLVVISVVALGTSVDLWRGQWLRFSYDHGSALFVLLPLALAGGATLGRRERRTRADELIASTGRPRWQRVTPTAVAIGAAVAAAHLLVFAGGAAVVAWTATYVSVGTLLTPLTGAILLTGAAWLGLAAGRAWPTPLLPPALAVVVLAAQVGLAESTDKLIGNLALLGQPPSYDWEALTGRALAGYLALGAGLAVGGFLLVAAASWRPRVLAAAVLAGAMVTAAVVPGTGAAARYYVDTDAQRLVCADGAPQVCLTAVHAYALPEVAPQVRRALTLLAKLPGAPRRAVEWRADAVGQPGTASSIPPAVKAGPDTLQFDLGLDVQRGVDPHLLESLVSGAGTALTGCPRSDVVARAAAGAWLMGTDDFFTADADARDRIRDTVHKLRGLPAAEQTRRVAALRDAAAACKEDLLPILTGESRP